MDGPYRATKLWNEMLHTFRHGMPLRRHRRHMKVYEDCFNGVEAVSWLQMALKSNPNIEPGITKSQVRQLLNKFMKAGVFVIVGGSNSGEDAEFKENEIYEFTSETSGFNLPPMQNVCREAGKFGKNNKGDINKVTSVLDTGLSSCPELRSNEASEHHDVPKSLILNRNCCIDGNINRKNAFPNKTNFLVECAEVNRSCSKKMMRSSSGPLLQSVFCAENQKERPPPVELAVKSLNQNRYGENEGIILEKVNHQHEHPQFHVEKNYHCKFSEEHGHETELPLKSASSHMLACSLAQPRSSQALNPYFQVRQAYPRPPLGDVNHSSADCREGLIVNVKNDASNPFNQPTKFQSARSSFKELEPNPQQISSRKSQHKHSSSVHEPGEINVVNSRHSYSSKGLCNSSNHFLHSAINTCPVNRQVHFGNGLAVKDQIHWEVSASAEELCKNVCASKQSTLLEDVWRKIFMWRLELLLVGMEELMALLPHTLPVKWLLENVTCGCGNSVCNDLDSGFQETIDGIQNEFTGIREPLITINLYNIVTQSYLYIERLSCKNCLSNSCQNMPASQSVENLILGMASPCPPKPEQQISLENYDQIISDNVLKHTVLPPNLCFETAFTSDSPVTRIVPQCAVDTLHLSRRAPISRSSRSLKFQRPQSPGNEPNYSEKEYPQGSKLKRNATFLSVPSGALQKNHSVQDTKIRPNMTQSREKSGSQGVRRPWRSSKKKSEVDHVVYSSQHCRNKSGGYVNPALSSSFDDISSHDLTSHEMDYNAALEMLQTLMQHSHVTSVPEKEPSPLGSNCDLSSENDSFYTASSTPDQRRVSDSSLSREPVWDEWSEPALGLGISIFQLLLLLVSPSSRRLLYRLLRCLHRLPSAVGATDAFQGVCSNVLKLHCPIYGIEKLPESEFPPWTKFPPLVNLEDCDNHIVHSFQPIMYSLTPNILSSQLEVEYDRALSYRVVKFLVANFEEVLKVPVDMQGQVAHHLKRPQKVTYCRQVSSQQFEQQRLTGSQSALSELLEQIITDSKMGEKERRRKIKLFRESYPHIYRRRFPELHGLRPSHEKLRGLLHFPSLGKLKNLRI